MIGTLRRSMSADFRGLPRRVAHEPRRIAQSWRLARKVASENGLSALRIFGEQTLLEKLHSINRYSYYLYRLFEPSLSWEERKSYLADDYYLEE